MLKKLALIIILTFYFSLSFFQKINLTTADLGRHITNGKVFLTEGKIVSSNFYSYTEPDFPVVTHHWLSGVIFYAIEETLGFNGLSVFYMLVSGLTAYLFFKSAERKSSTKIAFLVTLILIPLMANRREIRPEGFSYLFLGLYFYIFELLYDKKIEFKSALKVLVVSQILWVNLHLFFIMGIFISGVYFGNEFIKKNFRKEKHRLKEFGIILGVLVLASLVNPYFVKGLLEPLNIFKEYGYMIIENQPLFFMQKRDPRAIYLVVEILTLVMLWILITVYTSKRSKKYFHYVVFAITFLILSYKAIRGIPMFGMFMAPLLAIFIKDFLNIKDRLFLIPLVLIFAVGIFPNNYFSILKPGAGIGLHENVNSSAQFYKEEGLHGPIFNNYDLGGYLIYHLYNQEKVFVDNRPEAYSEDFLQNTYVKAQSTPEVWQQLDAQYDFQTIYFYRRDVTQWAQPFLIERIMDEKWVPVWVDDYVLILVKNNDQNRDIIETYQLPNNLFVVTN